MVEKINLPIKISGDTLSGIEFNQVVDKTNSLITEFNRTSGSSGSSGTSGLDGTSGINGLDGTSGSSGVSGSSGASGIDGSSGTSGSSGISGKSAYQSYLDTTTDNPVLTETQWSNQLGDILTLLTSI